MMRTINFVRQYLPAAFLIALGLTAYGCGDSVTVNPVAELASLTVSPGTLKPGFSGGTTQYRVDLTNDITSVTVRAQAAVSGDTVTINGQSTTSSTITLGAPVTTETTTSVSIVVSESSNNSRTYTILLVRAGLAGNNSLKNLTVLPGTLAPPFDANELFYTVDVLNSVGSVTVTPTLDDPAATMTLNGQPATSDQPQTITLGAAGKTTLIEIVVKAQNGNLKQYHVSVSRGVSSNNNLRSLIISPGKLDPAFTANEQFYRVDNVGSNVTKVTVTPTLDDSAATMTVNNIVAISGQPQIIDLRPAGQITLIEIFVKAENGIVKQYHVQVPRGTSGNNNLKNLTLSPGTLSPAFSSSTVGYTLNIPSVVPGNVTSVTVTPTLDDPTTASMTVNGEAATSGQVRTTPLPAPGLNTSITIVVTAQNNTQKTYIVNVIRAALAGDKNLQSLTVSSGTTNLPLAPPFNAGTLAYTVNVASTVTSVTVRPTLPPNSNASMSITVNSGNPSNINSGEGRTITLGPPDSNTFINIIVTAQNGSRNTYVVAVDRAPSNDNNLLALAVMSGKVAQPLSPSFARNTTSYTVDVASKVDKVTVSATKSDRYAAMAIGSVTVPPGTETGQADVKLGGQGSETLVLITVTPQIGSPKTYSVTISRLSSNTNLSALSVTAGTAVLPLSPPFDDPKKNRVSVATDITSVKVTATLEDTNATLVINGQGTSSGVPSAPITLGPQGSETDIPIVVIAPNGDRKDYNITVSRAAPAAPAQPASAPDLIPEDDSCLPDPTTADGCAPGTSRSDNITNVTPQRFGIPQPAAGETPSLYVDGKKDVSATFDPAANTLRTALSDGNYTITYTLTNAGGESPQSPPLCDPVRQVCTVTIDTVVSVP